MPRKPAVAAAIVGLGQIGFGFNADRKRKGVWTHERAFAASGEVELVAACDPLRDHRDRFKRARPGVPVFETLDQLLAARTPQLVSICAPTKVHAELSRRCALAGVKAVFCEKPVAAGAREASELVALCKRSRVTLAVNHTRRWDPAYRRAAELAASGRIGAVRSIASRYSGRVYNIGTHLIDAARMICGLAPRLASGISPEPSLEDPDVSGWLAFDRGVVMTLACHASPADLLFELDFIGVEGRLRLVDNGRTAILERFRPSPNAADTRELSAQRIAAAKGEDRFVAAVRDVVGALRNGHAPACTGEDGYYAVAAAEALAKSSREAGVPQPVAAL